MCNKNSSPVTMKKTKKQTKNSSISSSSSSNSSLKRRNRSKTRKPKYLSLRLQLSKKTTMTQQEEQKQEQEQQQQPQLNLFPLHPDNVDMHEENENNVALLFTSDGGATLNGLLEDECTTTSEEASFSPPAVVPAVDGGGDGGSWLVRKAMKRRRSKEESEEESEERWVSYSEVVEKKEVTEEVTSTVKEEENGGFVRWGVTTSFGLLSLKLDHEGILNAWSDKGSLYVAGGEAPQTVPELFDDASAAALLHNALPHPNVGWDGWGSDVGNTWTVPEDSGTNNMKVKEETVGWKLGQREASVQRYKEKRQNRLFSKKIRYEVRKLNAEKRPRMKGRFVKRE